MQAYFLPRPSLELGKLIGLVDKAMAQKLQNSRDLILGQKIHGELRERSYFLSLYFVLLTL